jgi:hypothetical protein
LVRRPGGFVIGSLMQIAMIAFGFVEPSFFIIGAVLIALWVAAIVVGRKGEAARAALLAAGPKKP